VAKDQGLAAPGTKAGLPVPAYVFPPADEADEEGIVAVGGDLAPATLLEAYRSGMFPMPLDPASSGRTLIAWWSPDPRGIIPIDGLHVSRSLRRSLKHYEVSVDAAFDAVVAGCADPRRPSGWITPEIRAAYGRLHELGWAHSVETWDTESGSLVGGVYGVAIGGLFAGESMFSTSTDASKVALVALVELLREDDRSGPVPPCRVLDVQWATRHLRTLGAVELPRRRYLDLLHQALDLPCPRAFAC
jgi:leucyl/phenylalanyl-tRNA--protein transferase